MTASAPPPSPSISSSPAFWTLAKADALRRARSDGLGLTETEAAGRRKQLGENVLGAPAQRSLARDIAAKLANPLVLLLLGSSAASAALGEVRSVLIIGAVVVLSVVVDLTQERRAAKVALLLQRQVEVRAHVKRDGVVRELPTREIVPGDLIRISAGDVIPADGLVLEEADLHVNQSALTGEAFPVEKDAAEDGAPKTGGADVNDARWAVFAGSSVVSGSATFVAVETGARTELGKTAQAATARPPPTEFERGAHAFGMLIMRLSFVLVVFVLVTSWALGRPWLESFMFAIAIAVGLTPELLPMVVSVALARGAQAMSRRRVVVKRSAAIENLGAMDILCTDKTGTLTEAKIRVARAFAVDGTDCRAALDAAVVNSVFETGIQSPLDTAIREAGVDVDTEGYTKIDEVPFDFERKRVSVLVEKDGFRSLIVKGAPEEIIRVCATAVAGGTDAEASAVPIDDAMRAKVAALLEAAGSEGLRVVAVARKSVERSVARAHVSVGDEAALVLVGFVSFADPPKASAKDALRRLADSGVSVKVVTGDHEAVARHVCAGVGLPVVDAMSGADVDALDDHGLAARAERTTLFCRASPAQKRRVILALKSRGHVVGYLGDGINDAPSIRAADVGISVDSAVDVAKDAAEIILMESDLGVLHDGVIEGRRTFANIEKYLLMGTSSAFGNMFSMAAATAFLPFLPMLPAQVLLNNLLYDVSEIAIPLDDVDDEATKRPRQLDVKFVRRFMFVLGPVSSAFDIAMFLILLWVFKANAELFHTAWFVESMATQVLVVFVIRTRRFWLKARPARALVISTTAALAVAVALPLMPFARLFGFVALPAPLYGVIAGLVVAYLLCADLAKRALFRWLVPAPGGARMPAIHRRESRR